MSEAVLTRSNVVLMARVDDPIQGRTLTTRSTVVTVEHPADEALATVVELALELAPDVKDWPRY